MAGIVEDELRTLARAKGPIEESVACKGTPLESITFTRDSRAFLFVMRKNGLNVVRLKLVASEPEGRKLAQKEPTHYELGANGWMKLTFSDESVPRKTLEKWISESWAAMGPPPEKRVAAKTVRRAAPRPKKSSAKKSKPKSKPKK